MLRIATLVALAGLLAAPAGAQTLAASDPRVETARAHVAGGALARGLAGADVADLAVTDAYADAAAGIAHVYLRQRLGGVPVPEGSVTVGVGRDGAVFHTAGTLVPGLAATRARQAALTAEAAAARVAALAGLGAASFAVAEAGAGPERRTVLTDGGVARAPVTARLVYRRAPGPDGVPAGALRLAWEVTLYQRDAQHWWILTVDAATGAELDRRDLVAHDTWGPAGDAVADAAEDLGPWLFDAAASAYAPTAAMVGSYRVYALPIESPSHAGSTTADLRTTVANPDDALASPFGWHDTNGVAGAEFTDTRGNNVSAQEDVDANDTPRRARPTAARR